MSCLPASRGAPGGNGPVFAPMTLWNLQKRPLQVSHQGTEASVRSFLSAPLFIQQTHPSSVTHLVPGVTGCEPGTHPQVITSGHTILFQNSFSSHFDVLQFFRLMLAPHTPFKVNWHWSCGAGGTSSFFYMLNIVLRLKATLFCFKPVLYDHFSGYQHKRLSCERSGAHF